MTSDNAIPRLVDEVPGAPRTETVAYRFPPARPCALPADRCTDDDVRRIITDALGNRSDLLALLSSPEHLRRVMDFAARIDRQHAFRTAELVGERMEVRRLSDLHIAASQTLAEVQVLHRVVCAENLALRRGAVLDVAFDRAARAAAPGAEREDQTLRYQSAEPDDRFDDDRDRDTQVVDVEDLARSGGRL